MKINKTVALLLAAGLVLPMGQFSLANAQDAKEERTNLSQRYVPFDKSLVKADSLEGNVVEVKFRQGANVAVQGKRIDSVAAGAKSSFTAAKATKVMPLFAAPKEELDANRASAQTFSEKEQSDLHNWVQITAENTAQARQIVKDLNKSGNVEVAYVRPNAVKMDVADAKPMAAANYESQQGYLGTPEQNYGINARYAHGIKGGDGTGVTIADVENGWDFNHPDLTKLRNASITRGTPSQAFEYHGTAVMGELVADKNGFGVTGIAYGASALVSHVTTAEYGYNPANAINVAAARLKAGDVLVIEQQTTGCGGGYAPMEVWPAVHDSIRSAVSKGIHVVQAAGNGSQNLDGSCYGNPFPAGRGDSGAIIVGAGAGYTAQGAVCGTANARQGFSSYGSRVNSFAWGQCVTTTWTNGGYTTGFSGTSSATPIVAGAVASLSGVAKARGISVSPAQMRSILSSTGTPAAQGQMIGTMPDLKKAIAKLGAGNGSPEPTPTPTPTADPTPKPSPEPGNGAKCSAYAKTLDSSIGRAGYGIFPNGRHYQATAGTHKFCVEGDGFTLELQKWNGSRWNSVAKTDAKQAISYDGGQGYYRLIVRSGGKQAPFKLGYDLGKITNL